MQKLRGRVRNSVKRKTALRPCLWNGWLFFWKCQCVIRIECRQVECSRPYWVKSRNETRHPAFSRMRTKVSQEKCWFRTRCKCRWSGVTSQRQSQRRWSWLPRNWHLWKREGLDLVKRFKSSKVLSQEALDQHRTFLFSWGGVEKANLGSKEKEIRSCFDLPNGGRWLTSKDLGSAVCETKTRSMRLLMDGWSG